LTRSFRVKAIGVICLFLLLRSVGLSGACAEKAPLPNVSSRLLSAVAELQAIGERGHEAPQWGQTPIGVRVDEAGRLEVMIQTMQVTPVELKELEGLGSSIEIYDAEQNLVQAWVPRDRIKEVAALPFVKFIDLPNYGVTNRPQE